MFTRFFTEFELPKKRMVKGYIEFTEYSGVQGYCFFVDGDFICLNINSPEITTEEEKELKNKLSIIDLYPMKIKSSDSRFNKEKQTLNPE